MVASGALVVLLAALVLMVAALAVLAALVAVHGPKKSPCNRGESGGGGLWHLIEQRPEFYDRVCD
tara:strand:- start:3396 stop:3590 length:195 start_codon:yes stop_codon:yes gene_type:complete